MGIFKKENWLVNTSNVEVGFVCKKCPNNSYEYLRKILFARNTGALLQANHTLISVNDKDCTTLFCDGIDLLEKIDGEDIVYPVVSEENLTVTDHDIIIYDTIEIGNFLKLLGYPPYLTERDLKVIKQGLLDPNIPLIRSALPVDFEDLRKLDLVKIQNNIKQIERFKSSGNDINVSKKEKGIQKSYKESKNFE